MKSISIGMEPIAVTSSYPMPQTVSEGDFAQSLQNAVKVAGSPAVAEQPIQDVIPPEHTVQTTPQQRVQNVPQQSVQVTQEQLVQDSPDPQVQVFPEQLVQDIIPEPQIQVIPEQLVQDIPEPQVQVIPEQSAESDTEPQVQAIPEQPVQDIPQTPVQNEAGLQIPQVPQEEQPRTQQAVHTPETVYVPELEQAEEVSEKPTQSTAVIQPDPELMKELADLLNSKEEMLTAPQRMRKTLDNMIVQALSELSDPEKKEEEFTEMVLNFLMEYIDRKFGGENEETSVFSDTDDKDDNVQDILLQTVVQMLEDIRSENAQSEVPEDEESVDGIPAGNTEREHVSTKASELLSEEAKQTIEMESAFVIPTAEVQSTAEPQQTNRFEISFETAAGTSEKATETQPEVQPTEAVQAQQTELYQAAAQAAESIYAAVTQQKPAEQVQPVTAYSAQPTREYRSREVSITSPIKPADELQELTRLVKGGDTVKSEQPQLDLSSRPQAEPIKPAVKLEATGELIPFEAAVTSTVPQITLTRPMESAARGAEQVVTQIASEIFNQLPENGGTTTFVMTLNPESLGKVTVKVVEEAGKISVSVTAHNKHTAEILTERFDSLQTAMKENGTQLEKYQVVYAPEQDERSGQQSFDGSSKNPYVKQENEESEGDGEFAELLQQAV